MKLGTSLDKNAQKFQQATVDDKNDISMESIGNYKFFFFFFML